MAISAVMFVPAGSSRLTRYLLSSFRRQFLCSRFTSLQAAAASQEHGGQVATIIRDETIFLLACRNVSD
jgi:hypothetical protein